MQRSTHLEVRASPFLFLKRLTVIEFFFGLLPVLILLLIDMWVSDVEGTYATLPFAGSMPFLLFATIAVTALQVLIVGVAFLSWYVPVYDIDQKAIVQKRGGLLGNRRLAGTPLIRQANVRQGRLGRQFNYGSIQLVHEAGQKAQLNDVPDPFPLAEAIEDLALAGEQEGLVEIPAVPRLIADGENQYVEFKASLMWDYRQQRVNKALYEPVMKNVVAFMNTTGGVLLIGVSDDGEILGLDADFQTMRKPNEDSYENVFNMAFNSMVGVEYREYVDVSFPRIDGKVICALHVRPAAQPAYLRQKGDEQFYIRAGNASQPLSVSKAAGYIQRHFPRRD